MFLVALIGFTKSRNQIVISVWFFLLLAIINLLLIDDLIGIPLWSMQASKFPDRTALDTMKALTAGACLFSFWFRRVEYNQFGVRNRVWSVSGLWAMVVISCFALYIFVDRGIRLNSSYLEFVGQRSVLDDYILLVVVVLSFMFRRNKVVLLSLFLAFVSMFLSGERLRSFILLTEYLLLSGWLNTALRYKIYLLVAYGGGELVSVVRSGLGLIQGKGDVFVSHFSGVTISTWYLRESLIDISIWEKFMFLIGLYLGNIVPSNLLPMQLDIREYLFASFDIPGGGWLHFWFIDLVGFIAGFAALYLLLVPLYRLSRRQDSVSQLFVLVSLLTIPRWLMYTPYQVLRMPLWGLLIFLMLVGFKNGRFKKT